MTTRLPCEDGDVTLSGKMFIERLYWTPSRYSFAMIQLADAVRRSVDLKLLASGGQPKLQTGLEWQIDDIFAQMSSALSPSMRVDALDHDMPVEPMELRAVARLRADMERWFFHQQLFHVYLELHSSEVQRVSIVCL
jgi:hypothetical protein